MLCMFFTYYFAKNLSELDVYAALTWPDENFKLKSLEQNLCCFIRCAFHIVLCLIAYEVFREIFILQFSVFILQILVLGIAYTYMSKR